MVSHLRVIEEKRMQAIFQKEQAERAEKIKKIDNSKAELNQWKA